MAITIGHHGRLLAGCVGALLLFTGCGGGGGGGGEAGIAAASKAAEPVPLPGPEPSSAPAASLLSGVSRLIVAGDSLADVGTFGFKFTVQDAASAGGFPVLPELVAAAHGLSAGCSHYKDDGAGGVVPRGLAACTNFAVGGGRLLDGEGPRDIRNQLRDAAAAVGGQFRAGDLVLVDGGGNDASDLAAGYLAGVTSRSGLVAFLAFLARRVEVDDLLSTIRGHDSLARSADLYMEEAADALAEAITAHALDRGAPRVAVLNLPDLTHTPRFAAAFDRLVQEEGAEEAAAVRAAVQRTIAAFNARLHERLGNYARVVLVDVRAAVDEELAHARDFGLTDVLHAACPVTGVNALGLPEWSLPTCTTTALDAAAPAGAAPGWWTGWAFSDGFHPTPTGHRLLAATVTRALAARAL